MNNSDESALDIAVNRMNDWEGSGLYMSVFRRYREMVDLLRDAGATGEGSHPITPISQS